MIQTGLKGVNRAHIAPCNMLESLMVREAIEGSFPCIVSPRTELR
jgi:hypothetical protein